MYLIQTVTIKSLSPNTLVITTTHHICVQLGPWTHSPALVSESFDRHHAAEATLDARKPE